MIDYMDITTLEGFSLQTLRQEWRQRYGAPPTFKSPELLAFMLGWRIQAEDSSGLNPDLRRALRRPVSEVSRDVSKPNSGTVLVREWQGVRHSVTSLPGGSFLYEGETHASLSEVARRITGTRWNGPRFFGLRVGQA